jgi:hypothetical protein
MKCLWLAFAGMVSAFAQLNLPAVSYATYLPADTATQIAVDPDGYAYVAGFNYDSRFPCTWTLTQSTSKAISYVIKLQPRGDGVVWTACVPGISAAVALDSAGSLYVAGSPLGSSTVTKLNPVDGKIIYSTSIPSAQTSSIAVDRAGNAYITGAARVGLPTTPGAYNSGSFCSGAASTCTDAFVVKVGTTGTVQYATYANKGGGANAIAVDSQGQVWITGTSSRSTVGTTDSFILKLDSTGGKRLFVTGFGGGLFFHVPASAGGLGIAIDSKDAAYAVGLVEFPIPTTPGTFQPAWPANYYTPVGYLLKLDSVGNTVYATSVGQGYDSLSRLLLTPQGTRISS